MADFALSSAVVLGQGIPAAAVSRSALPSALARLTLLPVRDGGDGETAAATAAAAHNDAVTSGSETAEGSAAAAAEANAEAGATRTEGSGARVLGDPLLSLTWLANHLARPGGRGGLRAGMVVITGAAAALGPDAVRWGRGCRLRGALEGLGGVGGGAVTGTVEVRIE
jgi:2-keto-4-pentenoate hydratase